MLCYFTFYFGAVKSSHQAVDAIKRLRFFREQPLYGNVLPQLDAAIRTRQGISLMQSARNRLLGLLVSQF